MKLCTMKIEAKDLIEEFYEKEKENYPDLSLDQFKDVCYGPWRFLKREMENGELNAVRLKYFGVFQVHKGRAKWMSTAIEERRDKNIITEDKYQQLKVMLTKFLKRHEDK